MSTEQKPRITNFADLIGELNGGVLEQQLGHMLSDVALGVAEHEQTGEVIIKLKLKRLGQGQMVNITSTASFVCPTLRGNRAEKIVCDTPMHVNKGGRLTVMPDTQTDMFLREKAQQ